MHSYLRAIGCSDMNSKQLEEMIQNIVKEPDYTTLTEDSRERDYVIYEKSFGKDIGICVCGEYHENSDFQCEYYFPYFRGSGITTREMIEVEKHIENESYAGICDEINLGVTLIFYVQNIAQYLTKKKLQQYNVSTTLSALSLNGIVLLPIQKKNSKDANRDTIIQNRSNLIAAARAGDEEAIENLTLEDMDTYSMISKRIQTEDVLSIVDTYFMPYGVESDQYSILAEIIDCTLIQNLVTGEELYRMKLECNNLNYDLIIRKKDLLGEPLPGRRFKGNVWMQGQLNYQE